MCLKLNAQEDQYYHTWIYSHLILKEFIDQHNLEEIAVNGKSLAEIIHEMCGSPQAAKLAHIKLKKYSHEHSYE